MTSVLEIAPPAIGDQLRCDTATPTRTAPRDGRLRIVTCRDGRRTTRMLPGADGRPLLDIAVVDLLLQAADHPTATPPQIAQLLDAVDTLIDVATAPAGNIDGPLDHTIDTALAILTPAA